MNHTKGDIFIKVYDFNIKHASPLCHRPSHFG